MDNAGWGAYADVASVTRRQELNTVNPREILADPASVLALAEQVCPSLNGPSSFRLAGFLEGIGADVDLADLAEFSGHIEALELLHASRVQYWQEALATLDADIVTVLDDAYPANLRMIHDHPPFLFVRGSLSAADDRAVAVIGTRKPSDEGVRIAQRIAKVLAQREVTVVSGMATGIDAAAHAAAINSGGRTLAVLGSGISRIYPTANAALSRAISASGAMVSQFWPDLGPSRWTFPVRNIVTSGLSLGTVVVEAGPTSGARQQAEHALRHGKRLFLLHRLVEHQPWAKDLVGRPGVVATDDVDEILSAVDLELDMQADVLV